jgi:hypothetical protein
MVLSNEPTPPSQLLQSDRQSEAANGDLYGQHSVTLSVESDCPQPQQLERSKSPKGFAALLSSRLLRLGQSAQRKEL